MKSIWNRRQILLQSTALFLLSCKGTVASTLMADDSIGKDNPALRIRRRWTSNAKDDAQQKFIKAVSWLKANDDKIFAPTDPRSWLAWKKLASVHAQSAEQGNWFFLPWHRLFLRYFEAACRFALQDENFALPYWDWTEDPSVFPEFFENDLLSANRDWKKSDRLPVEFMGAGMLSRILAIDEFFAFHSGAPANLAANYPRMTGLLEGASHHRLRNAIAGDMSGLSAANDPLFWLHHANIDRIWSLWALMHPADVLPPVAVDQASGTKPEAWLDTTLQLNYTEVVRSGGKTESRALPLPAVPAFGSSPAFPNKMAVKDLLQSDSLGYSYDSLTNEQPVFINLNIAPGRQSSKILNAESEIHASALVNRFAFDSSSKAVHRARQAQGSATIVCLNLPAAANGTRIRFFAFDGNAFRTAMIADLNKEDAWKRPEYQGAYSYFTPKDLPKSRQQKGGPNFNIDIGTWFRKNPGMNEIVLVALARDEQSQGSVDLFTTTTVEVQLQLNSSEK